MLNDDDIAQLFFKKQEWQLFSNSEKPKHLNFSRGTLSAYSERMSTEGLKKKEFQQ